MSKTKFTKVAVEERLPEQSGRYFVWVDNPNARGQENAEQYNMDKKVFDAFNREFKSFYDVTHWIEESPDREDEMIEMLRKIEDKLNDFHNDLAKSVIDMEVYNPLSSDLLKIKSLLQSLKQEK